MYYSTQSAISTTFSFPQRVFFYVVLVIICMLTISYLYVPNFVTQQIECSKWCVIDDVLMNLYGISDLRDGIMKQVTDSINLWEYSGKEEKVFAFSGSKNNTTSLSYVLRIKLQNAALPTIMITTQKGKAVSYVIMKDYINVENIYRKEKTPLVTNPIVLSSWSCDMITSLNYRLWWGTHADCTLSKYTQEDIMLDEESELYLFFVTRYDGMVSVSYK